MSCELTTGEVEYIDKTIADLKTENDQLVMKLNAEHLVRQNVERENAKLRKLVRDYERCTMHADCARCEHDGKMSTHCPLSPCFPDIDELNELGVDVP